MRSLFTFLFAAAIGAAAALLYAPQSGKKTRKKLKKRAKKMQLELEAQTEKGLESINEWKVNAEEFVEDAAKKVNGSTGPAFS